MYKFELTGTDGSKLEAVETNKMELSAQPDFQINLDINPGRVVSERTSKLNFLIKFLQDCYRKIQVKCLYLTNAFATVVVLMIIACSLNMLLLQWHPSPVRLLNLL